MIPACYTELLCRVYFVWEIYFQAILQVNIIILCLEISHQSSQRQKHKNKCVLVLEGASLLPLVTVLMIKRGTQCVTLLLEGLLKYCGN